MSNTAGVEMEELRVPEVGESISEVVIGQWHKKEGDPVERDEELVELESEKATFEAPSPTAGTLAKIIKGPGASAEVGEVIAYIDPSGKSSGGSSAPAAAASSPEPTPAAPAPQPSAPAPQAEAPQPPAPEPPTKPEFNRERSPNHLSHRDQPGANDPDLVETAPRVMPSAARLLGEHDISATDVEATGPGGRLLKEDVLRHVSDPPHAAAPAPQRPSAPAPAAPPAAANRSTSEREERKPMSPLRRRIASRLVEAQHNAALLTTFNEADLTAVKELRKEHGEAFQKKHGVKLGFMAFFVKAVVEALKNCPELNASIDGDELVYKNYFDIGIAIGTEKGLVVPILRDTDRMGFAEIENTIADYGVRARSGDLKIDEMMGGTFTISNGGVYGSLLSTPIVNPPQSGVLGMHSIQERPVAINGEVVIRPMMYLALTYDHRIVDGREAVTFLREIKEAIEEPARILIEI
ncbi:2-oxoglutarate dehydrogenase complex dihydrolipoyllysine-residue succinyltransferase [Aeoliella sp. ICT_H6.2]|uniref:Dihydrolipoyllysine-residue succinyltransferase component of 2-oxoglutarate dehydrogenase complex n=1 Tax=Aeoliella straminimaris TaxID=2954799 RepID=A0A9X2JI06_9BACT|nr:2-oxoglutarate dehydrogenase complex dihydrolipoyllysine-residue succinyltransferase [Aeoliella straminimaris]MCO6043454.1 2-oxoglutarate dehydrogenase complex dihydrolipoyllysine-residue succinyltransferase [Aeoliella straminimaris]